MSEANKRGYDNTFFHYVFGFFAWPFPESSVYAIPRRGRGVWSGVAAASRTLWVSSAETKDRRHYLIETTIISYSPLRPRFHSAFLQIVQLISQRRHTAPLSMDRAEFDKFADEYRAM
jgi:hypothetical protein